jgi:DNA polymerase III epsilon subunit family exonuclease
MFFDVLFPKVDAVVGGDEAAVFQLRRLKRYLPTPGQDLRSTPLVVFDLETTGLDFEVDRITEIGAQKIVGGKVVDQLETFVYTDVELTEDIQKLTGITPDMLADAPKIQDVLPKFLDFIDGALLVAHNAEFDIGMVKAAASRLGIDLEWPCFCTLKMAREFLADLENKKLDTLAAHYGLTFEARHRAIGDIKVTAAVLAAMLDNEASSLVSWSQMQPYTVS